MIDIAQLTVLSSFSTFVKSSQLNVINDVGWTTMLHLAPRDSV